MTPAFSRRRQRCYRSQCRSCVSLKPKISDFGAVDDERKRSIFLWHMQTPGISGVDFYVEIL